MSDPAERVWAAFFERFEAALPVDDMLGWVLENYPTATERQVMAMVQRIAGRDYLIRPVGSSERRYVVAGDTWNAFPQRVAFKPKGPPPAPPLV